MNVLVINGSPEIHGCTDRALLEVERILNQNGIDFAECEKQHYKNQHRYEIRHKRLRDSFKRREESNQMKCQKNQRSGSYADW